MHQSLGQRHQASHLGERLAAGDHHALGRQSGDGGGDGVDVHLDRLGRLIELRGALVRPFRAPPVPGVGRVAPDAVQVAAGEADEGADLAGVHALALDRAEDFRLAGRAGGDASCMARALPEEEAPDPLADALVVVGRVQRGDRGLGIGVRS